jgi:hypothetical protein
MKPDDRGSERKGWVERSRDGILLVLGVGMIIFEVVGTIYGRPVDSLIMGSAMILVAGDQALKAARDKL